MNEIRQYKEINESEKIRGTTNVPQAIHSTRISSPLFGDDGNIRGNPDTISGSWILLAVENSYIINSIMWEVGVSSIYNSIKDLMLYYYNNFLMHKIVSFAFNNRWILSNRNNKLF